MEGSASVDGKAMGVRQYQDGRTTLRGSWTSLPLGVATMALGASLALGHDSIGEKADI
jgi:hypothetical protein